jgi:uncharacterized protein
MIAARPSSPLTFFLLVFALSVPFWLISVVTELELLAALILVYRENKTAGVTALLKRSFDYKRIRAKVWYIPILLLMPSVMVLSHGLMRLLGLPLPTPHYPTVLAVLVMSFAFFIAALGEELGWSGYVIDPLQVRWNALRASLLLGLVCANWHIVSLVQAHRSLAWIAWWCLYTVAARVLIVWLYKSTGKSVFVAALFHAMLNVSWQLFPNNGSHFDPRIIGLIVAVVAAIITVVWGPRTLAWYRYA